MAAHNPTSAQGQTPAIDLATGHARDVEAQVIAQAAQDPAFRERVLAEPKAVFAEMGLRIPPEVQIQAVQETAEQYYLVLPAQAQAGSGAGASLSDAQLEAVAGGGSAVGPPTQDTHWTGCGSGQSGCVADPFGVITP